MPEDDDDFAQALITRELAMMADGLSLIEAAYRLAVMCSMRDALQLRAAIHELPSATTAP
jgi:hypothetical protein